MILSYNSTTADIGCAQYPNPKDTELIQAKERSASGITYTEDFSVEINTTTYNFIDMELLDYIALMEFFVNTVVGMMNQFTLTDDKGDSYTVRFTQSKLPFSETSFELWAGSFTVETQS
jgi:hypothetical protein